MGDASTAKMPPVGLQTAEHEELLNIIDDLRSIGISHYVDLPQLIVCGDQSSGKSSVLEAISGLQFPTKDDLCTRFATELILRRGPTPSLIVTIIPSADRGKSEAKALSEFQSPSNTIDEFASIIKTAEKAMGLDGDTKVFANDILRVELCGPKQPHLTLVDLPGIFYAGNRPQSDKDADLVQKMVKSYMEKGRSIILAVVSAKSDLAMQAITKMARDIDPQGQRTMGIITKPDLLFAGSDSENAYVKLAKNENICFKLGWHILKNRDYDTREATRAERDAAEKEFFTKRVWSKALPQTQLGVEKLRPRLSRVLLNQIEAELPGLNEDVDREFQSCKDRLDALGDPRTTRSQQRIYLSKTSQKFTSLITAAIDGNYTDAFFGGSDTKQGYAKRLRAVIQSTLSDFAQTLAREGHALQIVDTVPTRPSLSKNGPQTIARDKYLEGVTIKMRRNRGRELPGLFNPSIVGDLFFEQSKPWERILRETQEKLLSAAKTTVHMVLKHVAVDNATMEGILRHFIRPNMNPIYDKLDMKVVEVIKPHQRGHPLTFNEYFTENLQKKRHEATRKATAEKIKTFFSNDRESVKSGYISQGFYAKSLLDALAPGTEQDMEKFGSTEATNAMEAYYNVSEQSRPPFLLLTDPGCSEVGNRRIRHVRGGGMSA